MATDLDIDFILNERARELAGEQLRWFDLKRTGKLLERIRTYNTQALPNIQDYHILRPIPEGYPNLYNFEQTQNTGY